jgi:hypothetical protein
MIREVRGVIDCGQDILALQKRIVGRDCVAYQVEQALE